MGGGGACNPLCHYNGKYDLSFQVLVLEKMRALLKKKQSNIYKCEKYKM